MEIKTRSPNEEIKTLINNDNTLAHFGVLGMRWGVRKDRKTGGTRKTSPRHSSKSLSKMTDQELRDAVRRLQMEKQYAELRKAKRTFGKRMTNQALGILGNSTKRVATKIVEENVEKAVKTALKAIENAIVENIIEKELMR